MGSPINRLIQDLAMFAGLLDRGDMQIDQRFVGFDAVQNLEGKIQGLFWNEGFLSCLWGASKGFNELLGVRGLWICKTYL